MDKIKNIKDTKNIYHCDDCQFSSHNKSDYHKHLSTIKHTLKTQEMKAAFPLFQLEELPLKRVRKAKATITTMMICEPTSKNCTIHPPNTLVCSSDLVIRGCRNQTPVIEELDYRDTTVSDRTGSWGNLSCGKKSTFLSLVPSRLDFSLGTLCLVVIYVFIAINGTLLYMFYTVGC